MIDGGFFGVSACGRRAHWLSPTPVRGLGAEIGCASSPAVLERRRSLQLSSVGSYEPRKKPCDPSQTRPRFRIRLKPPSIQLAKASLAAQTLDMATSILGVSPSLQKLRVRFLRDAFLCVHTDEGSISTVGSRVSAVALLGKVFIFAGFYHELQAQNQSGVLKL